MPRSRVLALLLLVPVLVLLAACSDDGADVRSASGSGSGSGAGGGSAAGAQCEVIDGADAEADEAVEVTLTEYAIGVEPAEAAAGVVKFDVTNEGEEAHEMVVVQGAVDDLEVEDGQVQEDALAEGALIGELEAFDPGQCDATFELDAGDYVLFCNIVDDEHGHSHFEEGMVTPFTVTG